MHFLIEKIFNFEKKVQFQMCVWVVAGLPQRLNSMFFEIFSSVGYPKGTRNEEIFFKNVAFSL